MGCRFASIRLVCGDTLYPGGVYGKVWAGHTSDLSTQFPLTQATDVTTILFSAYNGLKMLEGVKNVHLFASTGNKGAGGNVSIEHSATLKLLAMSTQDDVAIQGLMQATDVFFIARNNRREFFIYGPTGMTYQPGALQSFGQAATDDTSDTIILTSTEIVKPLRFVPTGVSDIEAYLDARIV